jgi:hypothetical protein
MLTGTRRGTVEITRVDLCGGLATITAGSALPVATNVFVRVHSG